MSQVPPSRRRPVLLAPERAVTVTGEEHHQDVLAGRSGRVVVALVPRTGPTGTRRIEVLLDGCRVGELTRLMSERYLPLVDGVAAQGGLPGCEAVLKPDHRGVQVELRLPAMDAPARPRPDGPTARFGPTVPAPRPTPTAVVPVPAFPAPERPRRGRRRVVGATVAVLGVLFLAGALGEPATPEGPSAAAAGPTPAAVAAAAPATTTTATTTAEAAAPPAVVTSTTTTRARAAAPTTTRATTRTQAAPAPQARTTTRTTTRTATLAPEPEPEQSSGCHPSYSPCLPVVPDLNCPQIGHRVTVTGPDDYDLDRDGDGGGCESS